MNAVNSEQATINATEISFTQVTAAMPEAQIFEIGRLITSVRLNRDSEQAVPDSAVVVQPPIGATWHGLMDAMGSVLGAAELRVVRQPPKLSKLGVNDQLRITTVGIAEKYRRHGLGTYMLAQVAQLANQEELHELQIIPLRPRNRIFYNRLGFVNSSTSSDMIAYPKEVLQRA